jgi:hypothetical protein
MTAVDLDDDVVDATCAYIRWTSIRTRREKTYDDDLFDDKVDLRTAEVCYSL